MKIKRIETKNGRVMFYIDGKMKSEKDVPEDALKQLTGTMEIEYEAPAPEEKTLGEFDAHFCIFDQKPSTHKKFLLERLVGLCDEHYATKTTGKIAQRMKEL